MRAADSFDSAVDFLDDRLRTALLGVDSRVKESAYEIRLRAARPVVIVTRGGSLFVYESGRTGSVYSPGALAATPAELQASFSRMCGYSVHSNSAAAASGFISLAHGHRAGVCGTAVMAENGTVKAFRDISSVNLRIAHEVRGAADEIYTRLFNNGAVSAIIAGPPLSGKTTLLRDLARRLSGPSGGNFFRVAVVDERGEIDENFQKDNIAVKTVEHYLTSRVNASIGIAKNTEDVDTVVEFLGLLYGDGKYADILLYGQNVGLIII